MTGRAHACVSGERVHAKAELARYLYPHPHKGQSTNRPKKVVGNVTRYRNTRWRRIRLHPVHVQFPFPSPCPFHRLCLAHNDQCTALHLSLDKGRTIKTLGRPPHRRFPAMHCCRREAFVEITSSGGQDTL